MADDLARPGTDTEQNPVFCGVWTNWKHGPVMGSTLTLPRRDGDKLIALTAFFVALVASRFWRLTSQVYHRCYATQKPRDALHHQRQAILRNSVSALSDLLQFASLSWTWRGPVSRGFRRTMPVLITAALCTVGFAAASVLSSWISTALNNEVLISGERCGIISIFGEDITDRKLTQPLWARLASNAENYAQQCYSSKTTRMFDCTIFVRDQLPSSVNTKAPCPFKAEICRSDFSNLHLDTGLLDLDEDFGLNTPPSDRMSFRSVLHCAPLETEGYTSTRTTTHANYTGYHYGSTYIGPATLSPEDMTYEYLSRDSQYKSPDGHGIYNIYRLYESSLMLAEFGSTLSNHTTDVKGSTFIPIPELFRTDGDIELMFLVGNGVTFYERTEDPWYRGTVPGHMLNSTSGGSNMMYWPQEAASPLGCVRQYQFCNTALAPDKQCGPLAAWNDALAESAPLFNMTESQVFDDEDIPTGALPNLFGWVTVQLNNVALDFQRLLQGLGQQSLASKANLAGGIMGRLSSNQWKLDVAHWWSTYLASIQAAFVETAIGPADPSGELEQLKVGPYNDHTRNLCNNQKIHSSDYTSFSMFGLCFTYAMGILIILASYVTEPIFACLYRRWKYKEYPHLEWTSNSALHFQRMAYQGISSGTWSGHTDDIPRTEPGEMLADLPMRVTATGPMDVSKTSSTSDQTGELFDSLELDSLMDSDDAADLASLPADQIHGGGRYDTPVHV